MDVLIPGAGRSIHLSTFLSCMQNKKELGWSSEAVVLQVSYGDPGVLETLSGGPQGQNYYHHNTNISFSQAAEITIVFPYVIRWSLLCPWRSEE